MILGINKGGQINTVLLSHGPKKKAFPVPDSCRPTNKRQYISAYDTIENL